MLRRAIGLLLLAFPLAAQTTVTGSVYDSLSRHALAGATAQLFGPMDSATPTLFSAMTDSLGVFRIAGVREGRYAAGFFHPAVDSLGIEMTSRTVDVRAGSRIQLATPSTTRLSALICPDTPLTDSTAMIIGHVRDADTEQPIEGARIHVQWDEFGISKSGGFSTVAYKATSETSGPGWFAICGVPVTVALTARADDARGTSGYLGVELESRGVQHLTFHIAHAGAGGGDAANPSAPARVTGTVVDDAGAPILGAQVSLWQTKVGATTNERGAFVLDRVPAGTQTLEIRAIGAAPQRRVLDLVAGHTLTIDAKLPRAVALEAMQTRSQVVYSKGLLEFERHMRTAPGGYFVRPTEVGEHAGQDLVGLTRSAPTVVVTQTSDHRWQLLMVSPGAASITTGGQRTCVPPIFLNGHRSLMDFDDLVVAFPSDEILGLEVYNHLSEVPSDYQVDIASPCGAISLWTRPFSSSVKTSIKPQPPPR